MVKTREDNKPYDKIIYNNLRVYSLLSLYLSVPFIGIDDPNSRLINREKHWMVG